MTSWQTSHHLDRDRSDETRVSCTQRRRGFWNYDAKPGAGIVKSVDGGVNWAQLPSTGGWTSSIACAPSDSSGVLLRQRGTLGCGDHDAGSTGSTFSGPLPLPQTSSTTPFPEPRHGGNEKRDGAAGEVYYSTDYGSTFTEETTGAAGKLPSDGGRCEVAFAPSTLLQVYVAMDKNGGQRWRGTFGGGTWTLSEFRVNYMSDRDGMTTHSGSTHQSRYRRRRRCGALPEHGCCVTVVNLPDLHSTTTPSSSPGYNGSTNRIVYIGHDGGIEMTNDIVT